MRRTAGCSLFIFISALWFSLGMQLWLREKDSLNKLSRCPCTVFLEETFGGELWRKRGFGLF